MRYIGRIVRRSASLAAMLTLPTAVAPTVPTVIGITPTVGSTAGGTAIVIQVNDSTGATGGSVGGVALTGFGIVDATHVSGTTGAHAAGATDVIVTNASGASAPLVGAFTYVAAPTVIAVVPNSGPTGTAVVIQVASSAFATGASIGGVALTSFAIVDATHVSGIVGAHANGLVNTQVTNSGGTGTLNNSYTYTSAPNITSINYSQADPVGGGQTLVINGTGFATVAGAAGVQFLGTNATSYFVVSDILINAVVVPAHAAGTGVLTVTNSLGSDTEPFEYWEPKQLIGAPYDGFVLDAGKGVTLSGSDVDSWDDQGTNAYQFQPILLAKPVRAGAAFGTVAGIVFTPQSALYNSSGPLSYLRNMTLIVVVKWTSADATPTETDVNAPLTAVGDYQGNSSLNFGASAGAISTGVFDGTIWQQPTFGSGLNTGVPRMLTITKADNAAGSDLKAYLGTTQQDATYATGGAFTATTITDVGVGYNEVDGFNGSVGAIIALEDTTVVSAADLLKTYKWAQQRFGA